MARKKDNTGKLGGKEARETWQKKNSYPLQKLRDFRNHLIHGRMLPGLMGITYLLPQVGTESNYFDWRKMTDPANNPGLNTSDLLPIYSILSSAWLEVIGYLNDQWNKMLLK